MSDPSDLVGQSVGKYQILERIGQGGMAEVYRAFQPGLDRLVAIKAVHAFLARDENFIARFRREAQAVAELRHPNIVQVYDFDVYGGRPFMVLEYIHGVTLANIIDARAVEERALDIGEVLWIMQGLCSAVSYAHQQGIVHRDITPANVMITTEGRVVLTDFGLVRILGGVKFTATGQITGTPEYMSPEQAHGAPGDQRSDIYALGIVLYEALTGRPPYRGETPVSILLRHVTDPVPLIREVRGDLPDQFEAVLTRALAKDPENRVQSGEEMWHAIERAVPDELPLLDGAAAPPSLLSFEKKIGSKKRLTPVGLSVEISPAATMPSPPEENPAPLSSVLSRPATVPAMPSTNISTLSVQPVGEATAAAASADPAPTADRTSTVSLFHRIRGAVLFAALALTLGSIVIVGSSTLFQAWAGETPLAFWKSLSSSTGIFEPQSFSLRAVLPRTFAFAVLTLLTFCVPGFVLGALFQSLARAFDLFVNVLGYLFVALLTILCYNFFFAVQAIPVPVVQFVLAAVASFRQIASIATFNPVIPSMQLDRFTGELKDAVTKAAEGEGITSSLVERVVSECLQTDIVTNNYVGAWTLGYILVVSISIGSMAGSSKRHKIFFSMAAVALLTFTVLLGLAAVPSQISLSELDLGFVSLQIGDGTLPWIRGTWVVVALGALLAGVLSTAQKKPSVAHKAPLSNDIVE